MLGSDFRQFVRDHARSRSPEGVPVELVELFNGHSMPFYEDGQAYSWQAMVTCAYTGAAILGEPGMVAYSLYMGDTKPHSGAFVHTVTRPELAAGQRVRIPGEGLNDYAVVTAEAASVIIRGEALDEGAV